MESNGDIRNTCANCGFSITQVQKYCPECGKKVGSKTLFSSLLSLNFKDVTLLLCATLFVFGAGTGLRAIIHWHRGDVRPTQDFRSQKGHIPRDTGEPFEDPELDKLKAETAKDPNNIEKQKVLAGRFAEIFREHPEASQSLVFEAIDTLSTILKAAPQDSDALLMMADISFDQKAFSKALEYYEKYLAIEKEDWGARARYASTLTFLGRFDESINELNGIIRKDPVNFPATAYLAITYAQKGDAKKAREIGKRALEISPNEEARARFSSFMESLEAEQASGSNSPKEENSRGVASGESVLVAKVRNNPIAGQKFVKADTSERGTVKLFFKDFPMANMPPFAKEKFYSGLKEAVKSEPETKKLIFVDVSTNEIMDTLAVN